MNLRIVSTAYLVRLIIMTCVEEPLYKKISFFLKKLIISWTYRIYVSKRTFSSYSYVHSVNADSFQIALLLVCRA
jgi:hypothetical protein